MEPKLNKNYILYIDWSKTKCQDKISYHLKTKNETNPTHKQQSNLSIFMVNLTKLFSIFLLYRAVQGLNNHKNTSKTYKHKTYTYSHIDSTSIQTKITSIINASSPRHQINKSLVFIERSYIPVLCGGGQCHQSHHNWSHTRPQLWILLCASFR